MDALASCDLFVFPSPAEGFPKVIIDAMAVGLPVVATPSGELRALRAMGVTDTVGGGGPQAIATAIERVAGSPERGRTLRIRGHMFAVAHTGAAEAARLVDSWRARWPALFGS
jgi:glycosyltransferase involved in cell wall biosynthesis